MKIQRAFMKQFDRSPAFSSVAVARRLAVANVARLAIAVVALAAGGTAFAQETLKIGVLLPISGNNAADGSRVLRSHELAAKQINDAGGIKSLNGAKVELVVADTQSKPEISRSEAERLVNRNNVSAMIGALGSATTIPAVQVAERAKVPFLIPNAVADNLTEQGFKNVFRVAPKGRWAAESAEGFLKFLKSKDVKVDKLALVFEDGPYGQAVGKTYDAYLSGKGFQIVARESFRTGSSDLSTQVAKLKASGAEALLIVSYVDDETVLLRAMASQQFRPTVIGYGGGHVHPVLLKLGDLVEGTFGLVEWAPSISKPAAVAYVKSYEQENKGDTPFGSQAQAYAATWAVALAAEAAASREPQKIRDALASLKIGSGPATLLPTEGMQFDPTGQLPVTFVAVQIIGNKYVTVWPEAYASGSIVKSPK
jgi:branched-chain amino acid transport system substrate-binding protein